MNVKSISSRILIGFVLALVLLVALSACAPTETPPAATEEAEPTAPEETKPEEPAEPAEPPEEVLELEDELNVLTWGYYIDFAIEPFEEMYGVKVNVTYFDSFDSELNLIRSAGLGTYDIGHVGPVEGGPTIDDLDWAEGIDESKVPNFQNLYPAVQEWSYEFAPRGNPDAMTYAWGTTGLCINTDHIEEPYNTWEVLYDERYEGRTSINDQIQEMWGIVAIYLGLDMNDLSDANVAAIRASLEEMMPNVRTIWSTGDDLMEYMAAGEVWAAPCWDGLGRNMMTQGLPIVYVLPKEGARAWTDGPFIMKDAPHPEAAHAWINWLLSDEMQLKMTEEVLYSPVNSNVANMVDAERRRFLAIDDPSAIEELKLLRALTPEELTLLNEMFLEVKAGVSD